MSDNETRISVKITKTGEKTTAHVILPMVDEVSMQIGEEEVVTPPVDPTDPVDPPVDPVDPVDPPDPTDPIDPVDAEDDSPDATESHLEPLVIEALGGRIHEHPKKLYDFSEPERLRRQYDGTTTLNFNDTVEACEFTAKTHRGRPVIVKVAERVSKNGWGWGDYYHLEQDVNGNIVFEDFGDDLVIHVSAGPEALDAVAIAAIEKVAASTITGAWLLKNRQYGTIEKPLVWALADKLLEAIPVTDKYRPFVKVGFKNDHHYGGINTGNHRHGESAHKPRVFFGYGPGKQASGIGISSIKSFYLQHTVVIGLNISLGNTWENVILIDCEFDHEMEIGVENCRGLTIYRSTADDIIRKVPVAGPDATHWDPSGDRISAFYIAGVKGLWLQNKTSHSGWGFGYDIYRSAAKPQSPTGLSHDDYVQYSNIDATLIAMSVMAPSTSWQWRMGGVQKNCVVIDANIAAQNAGYKLDSYDKDGYYGNWALNLRTVATSAGHKNVIDGRIGAIAGGFDFSGPYSCNVDCLLMHKANPDDPAEIAEKRVTNNPLNNVTSGTYPALFDNTVVLGWGDNYATSNYNLDGLDVARMKQTTIQRYTAERLGVGIEEATIRRYYEWLKTLHAGKEIEDEHKRVHKYLMSARKEKMVTPFEERTVPTLLHFKPDYRCEGFRHDTLNWHTKGDPIDGDSFHLHGNLMKWVAHTRRIKEITSGEGGQIEVSAGKLYVERHLDEVDLTVRNTGLYETTDLVGRLNVRDHGYVKLHGEAHIHGKISGQARVALGSKTVVHEGKSLTVTGDMGWFGWNDEHDDAILDVYGDIVFEVTPLLLFKGYNTNPWWLDLGKFEGGVSGFKGVPDSWRRRQQDNYVRVRDAEGPLPQAAEVIGAPVPGVLHTFKPAVSSVIGAEIGRIDSWKSKPGQRRLTRFQGGSGVSIKGLQYLKNGVYNLNNHDIIMDGSPIFKTDGLEMNQGQLTLTVG